MRDLGKPKTSKTLKPREVIASVTRRMRRDCKTCHGSRMRGIQRLSQTQNFDLRAPRVRASYSNNPSLAGLLPSQPSLPHKPAGRSEIAIYAYVEIQISHLGRRVDSGMFLLVEALARNVSSQVSFVDGRFCVCT